MLGPRGNNYPGKVPDCIIVADSADEGNKKLTREYKSVRATTDEVEHRQSATN
jgi:hypothetical protein